MAAVFNDLKKVRITSFSKLCNADGKFNDKQRVKQRFPAPPTVLLYAHAKLVIHLCRALYTCCLCQVPGWFYGFVHSCSAYKVRNTLPYFWYSCSRREYKTLPHH